MPIHIYPYEFPHPVDSRLRGNDGEAPRVKRSEVVFSSTPYEHRSAKHDDSSSK